MNTAIHIQLPDRNRRPFPRVWPREASQWRTKAVSRKATSVDRRPRQLQLSLRSNVGLRWRSSLIATWVLWQAWIRMTRFYIDTESSASCVYNVDCSTCSVQGINHHHQFNTKPTNRGRSVLDSNAALSNPVLARSVGGNGCGKPCRDGLTHGFLLVFICYIPCATIPEGFVSDPPP